MSEIFDKTILEFTDELSSSAPTPGGGGAAALVASVGIALGNMVANLTIGKKEYALSEEELINLRKSAEKLQEDFLLLITRDAEAFAPVIDSYKMPSKTGSEKKAKEKALQEALINAAQVSFDMMKKCSLAICLLERFYKKGNKNVLSDVACGIQICKAALASSWINVCINTSMIKDEGVVNELNSKGKEILENYSHIADSVYKEIEEKYI